MDPLERFLDMLPANHGAGNLAVASQAAPCPAPIQGLLDVTFSLPAVLFDQPNALVPLDILQRLELHARQAQGALAPATERALRKASAAG